MPPSPSMLLQMAKFHSFFYYTGRKWGPRKPTDLPGGRARVSSESLDSSLSFPTFPALWRGGCLRFFPSSETLDLDVSFWSENSSADSPLISPVRGLASARPAAPLLGGSPAGGLRATGSLFVKRVKCCLAGLMGGWNDVIALGSVAWDKALGFGSRQACLGRCFPTSNLCAFAQGTSVSECPFLQL